MCKYCCNIFKYHVFLFMKKNTGKLPLTYHISFANDLLKSALQKRLKASGLNITAGQLAVLRLLSTQPEGVSMQFISTQSCRDNSAVSRIIDTLQKKHYVQRVPSKTDRRIKTICMSELGLDVFTKASEIAKQHVAKAINGISENETSQLIETLTKIQNNL